MKYCENGNHRYHVRSKLVEPSCGDSGWLCPGDKRKRTKRPTVAKRRPHEGVLKVRVSGGRKVMVSELRKCMRQVSVDLAQRLHVLSVRWYIVNDTGVVQRGTPTKRKRTRREVNEPAYTRD
jgi:hypothetical protein